MSEMDHDLECEEAYLRGEKDQQDKEPMKTIDVPAKVEPQRALTVRDAVAAVEKVAEPVKPQITVAQAKVEAIAKLTESAYAKAATLSLTTEESAALQAEFPNEAFRTGAAGKEELIYLEHFALRERLNRVLGLGQWAIIPRSRWAEDFEYWDKYGKKYEKASRVYVEAMLIIRGCFVSESIGDMVYYPKNQSTNYGDAVEGAQSDALRRCCKNFGIGLQAWSKTFQEGWWQRKRGQQPPQRPPSPTAAPKPQAPPAAPQQPQGGEQVYPVATVKLVTEQTGTRKKDGKPWRRYDILLSDGFADIEVSTFSKTLGQAAERFSESEVNVKVVVKPSQFMEGKLDLVSIEETAAPREPDSLPLDGNPSEYGDGPPDVNP